MSKPSDKHKPSGQVAYYRIMAPGDPYRRCFQTLADAEQTMRAINRQGTTIRAFTWAGKIVRLEQPRNGEGCRHG